MEKSKDGHFSIRLINGFNNAQSRRMRQYTLVYADKQNQNKHS